MTTDVIERLANYRSVLDDAIETDLATRQPTGRPPARRQSTLVAASTVVIVAVGIGALAWTRSDQPTSSSSSLLIDLPVTTDTNAAPPITDLPATTEAPQPPQRTTPPDPTPIERGATTDTYIVQTGDYPILVAEKFCTTVSALVAVNGWTTLNEFPAPDVEMIVPVTVDGANCPDPAS